MKRAAEAVDRRHPRERTAEVSHQAAAEPRRDQRKGGSIVGDLDDELGGDIDDEVEGDIGGDIGTGDLGDEGDLEDI